jgi:hypothetical protein
MNFKNFYCIFKSFFGGWVGQPRLAFTKIFEMRK